MLFHPFLRRSYSFYVHFCLEKLWCKFVGTALVRVVGTALVRGRCGRGITLCRYPKQARDVQPMLLQCWASVVDHFYDADPTLYHHWLNVSCLLRCDKALYDDNRRLIPLEMWSNGKFLCCTIFMSNTGHPVVLSSIRSTPCRMTVWYWSAAQAQADTAFRLCRVVCIFVCV